MQWRRSNNLARMREVEPYLGDYPSDMVTPKRVPRRPPPRDRGVLVSLPAIGFGMIVVAALCVIAAIITSIGWVASRVL